MIQDDLCWAEATPLQPFGLLPALLQCVLLWVAKFALPLNIWYAPQIWRNALGNLASHWVLLLPVGLWECGGAQQVSCVM